MNGQPVDGGNTKLYVSRAQKKKERQQELMRKHEADKMERYTRRVVCASLRWKSHIGGSLQVSGCQLVCEES